jgi:hypothetical protein
MEAFRASGKVPLAAAARLPESLRRAAEQRVSAGVAVYQGMQVLCHFPR